MTTFNENHAADAFIWLGNSLAKGQVPAISRNRLTIQRDPGRSGIGDLPKASYPYVKDLLIGRPRKWAQGWVEHALDIELTSNNIPLSVSGVILNERSAIDGGYSYDMRDAKQREKLKRQLVGVRRFVLNVRAQPVLDGLCQILAILGDGAHGKDIIISTVTLRETIDYKDHLAGSFWVNIPASATQKTGIHKALLCAVQAKTLRRTIIPETAHSSFRINYARRLKAKDKPVADIARLTGIPAQGLEKLFARRARIPSKKMYSFARRLAREDKVNIPVGAATNADICSAFIDEIMVHRGEGDRSRRNLHERRIEDTPKTTGEAFRQNGTNSRSDQSKPSDKQILFWARITAEFPILIEIYGTDIALSGPKMKTALDQVHVHLATWREKMRNGALTDTMIKQDLKK